MQLAEGKFYTGAIKAPENLQAKSFDNLLGASEIDWDKGYDIRNELNGHIVLKDQRQSLSCTAQAWSYHVWIFQILEMMKKYGMTLKGLREFFPYEIEEISAKAIYSQTFFNEGGSYIYKGAELVSKWGAVTESKVKSKMKDGSVTEEFMRDLSWKNKEVDKLANILKGKEPRIIRARDNINVFAQAVLQCKGVVGGVYGQNGRGWSTERPQPPEKTSKIDWGHCIFYGAFGKDEYGKFIATPNSWGEMWWNNGYIWKPGDPPGKGWQKLYEDYFTEDYQFDPWTYTDLTNKDMSNDFVRVVKDANSKAIGFFLPAYSEQTLKNMARMYGKEIPLKEDGSIDFTNLVDGTATFKTPLVTD